MRTSTSGRGRGLAAGALVVLAALSLGGCGTEHATTAGAAGRTGGTAGESGGTGRAGNTGSTGGTGGTTPSPSLSSPYVEPGAGDGAPHYRENNGFRIAGDMSEASAGAARREADRIEPELKRLWKQGVWDPASVRAAMIKLGYEVEGPGDEGSTSGRALRVEPMRARFETDREVTPEGARVALFVRRDACVTAFTQKTNYQVSVNGPYPETGCFEPPSGH
ncbi:hypothetical protein [Streptomyces sp. ITFR-6]|uniref:hypothetical protein n=1 Tax=Streptomyces sp. ITFR-6 TaxID=3075197 RepID=UPI0028891646|nr:hypothetical protein [Streptomyces sp. ITFR-6]WNI32157.1 hypothetical protein RLT59_27815 [Streptomyces sp. ITFR-6]